MSYDAIVVGAGHNGLTTACFLARAGLKVLVVERNDHVGGAAVSRELTPGWTYSNCSYVCSLLRPEIIRALELPKYGLQVIPYESGATFDSRGGYFSYSSDHDALRRELMRLDPRDADGYDRFSRAVMKQCRFIKPLLLRTAPDPTSLKPRDLSELLFILRRFNDLGAADMAETLRFWTMSIAEFLDEYLRSDIVKAHIAGSGIIGTGLGPYSPGTAYVLLHHYMGEVDGAIGAWGFARGGMGAITQAMAASLVASGGEIRTGAGLDRFLVKDGRVTGVALANGDEFHARTVVSGMDVRRTFLDHAEARDLPEDFLKGVRRFRFRGSSGKLNIALDAMPRFTAAPEGAGFLRGDLHFLDDMAEIERAYDDWKAGRWSARPYLDFLIPTQIDPTMAPPGKHYATVFVQYAPYAPEGGWNDARREDFARTVIDRVEEHAPGFADLIVHKEVRTPADIEREVGLSEGNIFQGELTFDQLLFNRPVPGWAQYRSPIRGLYMCASSTHPGGGVMGAPGANAAREILRDLGRRIDMGAAA
ncbi:MAG: NAD(P)/FAD-dependent oxidoreductase [Defluviimonas sp.]|uniref:phytoene desaturase family protein n=1 Tax=Albidovulum sp. TaxID=1872424 RepID=UPI001D4D45B4|nr:NAD(P)/FAD-dependent oxidoreductase [Paracoccaceae bacterium]MCC0064143.1 NAD(P)/FAD-dependent oxidoreductase [Defluviimonas sp.]